MEEFGLYLAAGNTMEQGRKAAVSFLDRGPARSRYRGGMGGIAWDNLARTLIKEIDLYQEENT